MRHLLIGAVVALAIIVAGTIAITQRTETFTADARVLIGPAEGVANPVLALDTLSRGTVVATYAEIFGSDEVVETALASSGFDAAAQEDITIRTRSLAGASAVLVEAVAPSADTAERAATAVATATPVLEGYQEVFQVTLLQGAQGRAEGSGIDNGALIAFLIAVGLALGAAASSAARRYLPQDTRPSGATPPRA